VKTLKISEQTHAELKKFGEFGDTFDTIIMRLINKAKASKK